MTRSFVDQLEREISSDMEEEIRIVQYLKSLERV
jgi:hypothetical protein